MSSRAPPYSCQNLIRAPGFWLIGVLEDVGSGLAVRLNEGVFTMPQPQAPCLLGAAPQGPVCAGLEGTICGWKGQGASREPNLICYPLNSFV